jgi:hypothetical protein
MPQLQLIQALEPPETRSSQRSPQSPTLPKKVAAIAIEKIEIQSEEILLDRRVAPDGLCRGCSCPIALPELDASLCSRGCGWIVDSQHLVAKGNQSKGGK